MISAPRFMYFKAGAFAHLMALTLLVPSPLDQMIFKNLTI